jgi:hypothetical protein
VEEQRVGDFNIAWKRCALTTAMDEAAIRAPRKTGALDLIFLQLVPRCFGSRKVRLRL